MAQQKVTSSGYPFTVDEMPSIETINQRIAWLSNPEFSFSYNRWRHGGSYTNVRYPNGCVGCVSSASKTISGKFEIDFRGPDGSRMKFKTRLQAAQAERLIVLEMWEALRSELSA